MGTDALQSASDANGKTPHLRLIAFMLFAFDPFRVEFKFSLQGKSNNLTCKLTLLNLLFIMSFSFTIHH